MDVHVCSQFIKDQDKKLRAAEAAASAVCFLPSRPLPVLLLTPSSTTGQLRRRGAESAAGDYAIEGGVATAKGAFAFLLPAFVPIPSSSAALSSAVLTFIRSPTQINHAELESYYRREQQLMLSAWHDLGMRAMRERVAATPTRGAGTAGVGTKAYSTAGVGAVGGYQPQSWLSQQRAKASGKGLVRRFSRCSLLL
jgi:hypothetical protein